MLCVHTLRQTLKIKNPLGFAKRGFMSFQQTAVRTQTLPVRVVPVIISRKYHHNPGDNWTVPGILSAVRGSYERFLRRYNVLYIIIGLNVIVFLLWQVFGSQKEGAIIMRDNFISSINHIKRHRYWTILTSTFSHQSPSHLIFNMMGLYFLGQNLYYTIGATRFFHLYLAGGVASTIATLILHQMKGSQNPYSKRQMDQMGVLGASGSVMSVVTLFGLLFPKQPVYIYFVLPVPAIALVGLYIGADVWGLANSSSGVSNAGHLAGALVGAGYFYYSMRTGRIARTW
eukprot:TRINITY_DN3479_c0_g1_i1.p1 TRINITY_DN3479_c0_g1~~TRINITY_DN3479_c0_g1_i1.p1  ORF type:complete len:286 (-),score=26.15 TRINITY_DN3479_c0_g1_i1:56-913(-)